MISPAIKSSLFGSLVKPLVRHASTKTDKIPVQLLKDHPTLGFKGEIVKVRPAFMRNYLHVDNKACYITATQGPRIPITEKTKEFQEAKRAAFAKAKAEAQVELDTETETSDNEPAGAMSLNELSNLFNTMRSSRSLKESARTSTTIAADISEATDVAAADEVIYSSNDLNESVPRVYTIVLKNGLSLPITREYLSSSIFQFSGVKIPTRSIKLREENSKDLISEVEKIGTYVMSIDIPSENKSIIRSLVIQKESEN